MSQKRGAINRSGLISIVGTVVVTVIGGLIIYQIGDLKDQKKWENPEIPENLYKIGVAMINKYNNPL